MSTKTTLKRIALVAVSALGLGMLSVAPSSAARTTGFSVNANSMTVVNAAGTSTMNDLYGVFEITLSDELATSTALDNGETLVAEVIGAPTPVAPDTAVIGNVNLSWVGGVTTTYDSSTGAVANDTMTASTSAEAYFASASTYGTNQETPLVVNLGGTTTARGITTATSTYLLRVQSANAATHSNTAIGKGFYTIRIALLDVNKNAVATRNVTVSFASSKLNSGASLVASATGTKSVGETLTISSTSSFTATLTNSNGGLVRENGNASPALSVELYDATATTPVRIDTSSVIQVIDDGYTRDAGTTKVALNGVYGITSTAPAIKPGTAGTSTMTVRYGNASANATFTLIGAASATGGTTAAPTVTATGISYLSSATPWYVPLTTKEATVSVNAGTANYPVTFTVTYTNTAAGDVSPVASTPTLVYSDAAGIASLKVTNNSPVHGATATVAISGFTTAVTSQVIEWRDNRAAVLTTSPVSQTVKLASTNVVTATVTDAFGNPVSGAVLQPAVAGSNAPTTALATVTTNAMGEASYTLTDAKAVADGTDTVSFTVLGATLLSSGSTTFTYKATVPVIASITGYYSLDATSASRSVASSPVPTTGITQGDGSYLQIGTNRNYSKILPASTGSGTGDDVIGLRFLARTSALAAAAGVPVVLTGTDGVYFLNSSGLAVKTITLVTSSTGYVHVAVGSTKTGANTVTATAGTVTSTAAFWTANAASDARFVTLTGDATATANGEAKPYVAKVTDRFGNPVAGVTFSISASGVAVLGGGSTLTSFTTDSTGSFSFMGTSLTSAGGTGTFKVTGSVTGVDQLDSSAGYAGTDVIDSTVAAGNDSASVAVTFAAGQSASQVAAEAATDAALEAIDAANAATDAANLAAEAADAATVAAEEARDAADAATAAVEALASEVATLIAGLKAQITTLANTVAKIAKRVRA